MRARKIRGSSAAMIAARALLPGTAAAGGFATVGLSSLPDGTAPGGTWHVTLTVLQHGRTPLDDLQPHVFVRSADGRTLRTFAARPAGKRGVYTADVVFPAAGRWRYSIADGFSQTHTYAPVTIGRVAAPPAAAAPGRSDSGRGDVGAALA